MGGRRNNQLHTRLYVCDYLKGCSVREGFVLQVSSANSLSATGTHTTWPKDSLVWPSLYVARFFNSPTADPRTSLSGGEFLPEGLVQNEQ